jgi:hypothetical protein
MRRSDDSFVAGRLHDVMVAFSLRAASLSSGLWHERDRIDRLIERKYGRTLGKATCGNRCTQAAAS